MLVKTYLSRRQTKAMSSEYPIGDPTGGAAYREMRDPATAMGVSAGANLLGSVIGGEASKSAANTQVKASKQAIAQQYQAAQAAIANQQQVLDAQIRNSGGVQTAQTQQLQDTLNQQLAIAQQTRDAQLAVAAQTRDAQLGVSREVLGKQEGAYNPYQEAGLAGQNQLLNYLGIGADRGSQGYGQYANAQFTPEAFAANQDPGYAFRMKEGLKAVDAQAAARGGLISGAALKASQRFGQDMASQEYQNAFNRYQTSRQATLAPYQQLQGAGMQAAGGLSNAAGGYGTNALGAYGGYGTAAGNAYGGYGAAAGNAYGALGTGIYNATGTAGGQINSAYGNYGNQVTGALTGFGGNQANLTTGAANAQAAGQVGQANALNQGISGASNAYYQNQMLNLFRNNQTNPAMQAGATNTYNSMMNNGGFGSGAAFGNQDLGQNF